ncbi:hypothetical protein CWO03_22760 [Vibrio splendidus]|nr:hypothetical protein CWN81_20545 [Vibrio splendidus]PTP81873.1 hypothetical protein CWO03_22760 [Vibrio splendidus]
MLIVQALTYVVPLLTIPVIINAVGVSNFGLVTFSQSFLMFFYLLIDFGFSISSTKEFSLAKNDNDISYILSNLLVAKLILSLVSFFVLCLLLYLVPAFKENYLLHLLSYLWVLGQGFSPIWYFQGRESIKLYTLVQAVGKLIYLISIFLFIKTIDDYIYIPLINGMTVILITIYLYYAIFSKDMIKLSLLSVTKNSVMLVIKNSSKFFLSRVSVVLYSTANVFFLGIHSTPIAVGYYAVAEKVYIAVQSLASPVVQVLYPHMCKTKDVVFFKKALLISLLSVLIVAGIVVYFSNFFVSFISASNASDVSVQTLKILMCAVTFSVTSMLIGYPLLGALGYPNYANNSVIFSSVFHLIALAVLYVSNLLSPYSLAALVVITQSVDCLYRVYFVRQLRLFS